MNVKDKLEMTRFRKKKKKKHRQRSTNLYTPICCPLSAMLAKMSNQI